MSKRRALYDPHQTHPTPLAGRPAAKAAPSPPLPRECKFHIAAAWIDTAGRTRTWALRDPEGETVAEITTKQAARSLAALLNRALPSGQYFHETSPQK